MSDRTMRSNYTFLIVLVSALSCIGTQPDTTDYVNIIKKFRQGFKSSPSESVFHHGSDGVQPSGDNAAINHSKRKIAGQLKMEKQAEMNDHGKIGTYKVAGGYGFSISHDYGSHRSQTEAPHVEYINSPGASNADLASIAVLQLNSNNFASPSIDVGERSKSIGAGKSEGLDGYIGKEIYGSSMEYDKLVKGSKKAPSVYPPGKYYESDVYGDKEKYDSDDGYDESNKRDKKMRYLESEKYHGSQDYNENEDYAALKRNVDYIDYDFDDKGELGRDEGHRGSENHHENYEAPSMYAGFEDGNTEPKFENMQKSFLDDFFKEYNEFSNSHIKAGFANDRQYDDDYDGRYAEEDEQGLYNENGESEKDFFDDSNSNGNHYEEEHGDKNSNFGEKKGHKKGSKTTGYHNVFNKDEYTKDHEFYENANNNGHFNKDGDYAEHDHQNEGSYEKTSHHDSSSNDDHHGKTDDDDKGYFIKDDLSDDDEHGYKSYSNDYSDYADKGNNRYESEYEEGYGHNN